jgi:ABC-2 type transport system ATP-binding protein
VRLYGSLLGLRRNEVARRFDEIVAFAELESAIDRQVKFYSSGMQMRLGFAVAAFLEPDVLLVDEVLAVGDAAFQQKCLERMRVVLTQGTTLIFVSHDLAAVEATCDRGLWLAGGVVQADGPVRDVLAGYRRSVEESAKFSSHIAGTLRLVKAELAASGGGAPKTQKPLDVTLTLDSPRKLTGRILIGVSEGTATPIFVVRKDMTLDKGETSVRCSIRRLPLPRGRFYVWAGIFEAKGVDLLPWQPVAQFDTIGPELDSVPTGVVRLAPVHVETEWTSERQ